MTFFADYLLKVHLHQSLDIKSHKEVTDPDPGGPKPVNSTDPDPQHWIEIKEMITIN